jgi:hypothetical protein
MTTPYIQPGTNLTAFHCPHCGAFSRQLWSTLTANILAGDFTPTSPTKPARMTQGVSECYISFCDHCGKYDVWVGTRMVYPDIVGGVAPHADMPAEIKTDYEEARGIVTKSPRGAAALLRLCVEKLCKHLLKEKSKDINADIAMLVSAGLPVGVQQALDTVRVIGNECVHAGQMDLRDDERTAGRLFALVNFIVEDRITRPREIAALYATLPPTKLEGIEKRDAAKPT